MKILFLVVLCALSIASSVKAEGYSSASKSAYLKELRGILVNQEVNPKIVDLMDEHLLATGNVYCVWKQRPEIFEGYDRVGLANLKNTEESLSDHPMKYELYKYHLLVHTIHKSIAEKHLCPGNL